MKQFFRRHRETAGICLLLAFTVTGTILAGCSGGSLNSPTIPDSARPYIGAFAGTATLSSTRAVSLALSTNASSRATGTLTISDPGGVLGNASLFGTVDLTSGNFTTTGIFFYQGTATDVIVSGKLPTGPGNYRLGTLQGSGSLVRTDATPTPTPTPSPTPTPTPTP